MPTVSIGDATLNVEERGAGPVLLLVHGYPLDHQMWRHQLDEFSRDFRVIAPDLRGFGQSTITPGVVTMQRYADDMAALLEALGAREAVTFCGLSMGGYIAWEFALRHRSRLAKLILCDTKASADTPEGAAGRLASAQKVLAEGPQVIVDGMLAKLFAPQTAEQQADTVKSTRKIMLAAKPDGIAAALRGMAERTDMVGRLKSFDMPALVLCGEHDAIATVDEMQGIASNLPQATFAAIPNAGHMAPLENPTAVNAAMRRFLQ
jgi:pimeloyl-ACP methyl ester carboxylesterase